MTVHGSLLRTAIEAAGAVRLGEATDAVERALSARFGPGAVDGRNYALIVTTIPMQHQDGDQISLKPD